MYFTILYREINSFTYQYNIQLKIFHIYDFWLRGVSYGAFAINLWAACRFV
jgi:hypothetical protein